MRDLLVLTIIFGSLPVCFARPWLGVLMFSWISYMNPHRYTWSFAYAFPVALIVAVPTILGFLANSQPKRLPASRETYILAALWALFALTTLFAFNDDATTQLIVVSKILFMTFITMLVIDDQRKFRYLLGVIALSIGLVGVKGGVWALLSGGSNRVYGPPGSFIYDNNDFALAANMTLPLLFYLARTESRKWLKVGLYAAFGLTIVSIVFTYSRGGFVALGLVIALLLVKARYKTLALAIVLIGAVVGASMIPAAWTERMETISEYEDDASAHGRLNAWATAVNIALARPLTGGGFETFVDEVYRDYSPEPWNVRAVHSIYFEMLGEHGFPGITLFVALLASTLLTLRGLKRRARRDANLAWMAPYADMLETSLIAYMAGGAFLGRAYFDLFYHLVASAVILRSLSHQAAPQTAVVLERAPDSPAVARAHLLWALRVRR